MIIGLEMTKAGDAYQEVVAAVQRALDPGAVVRSGQWIEGPDGRRDLDVEVRGTREGRPFFTMIECKDWAKPVGIIVVDEADSKRHDLGADATIIFSNSGFAAPALRKATRKGIGCASAIVAGDQRVHVVIERELVARRLSVDRWSVELFPVSGLDKLPVNYDARELMRSGLPVVNWLHKVSAALLHEHDGAEEVIETYTFNEPTDFQFSGITVTSRGLRLRLWCSQKWMSQRISVDVTRGVYDHITGKVVVPNEQSLILGPIDREGWKEVDAGTMEAEKKLEPGSFDVRIILVNPIAPKVGQATPDIDALVSKAEISAS